MKVCVFCAASETISVVYKQAAVALGAVLVRHGYTLVYGGGRVGLMGVLGETVSKGGGTTIGVIPERLFSRERAFKEASELVITPDMRTRKAALEARSDVMVALPGGFGTLEELIETITGKYLGYHQKPIFILNINGFFDSLLTVFNQYVAEGFAPATHLKVFEVVSSVSALESRLQAFAQFPTVETAISKG